MGGVVLLMKRSLDFRQITKKAWLLPIPDALRDARRGRVDDSYGDPLYRHEDPAHHAARLFHRVYDSRNRRRDRVVGIRDRAIAGPLRCIIRKYHHRSGVGFMAPHTLYARELTRLGGRAVRNHSSAPHPHGLAV